MDTERPDIQAGARCPPWSPGPARRAGTDGRCGVPAPSKGLREGGRRRSLCVSEGQVLGALNTQQRQPKASSSVFALHRGRLSL